MSFVSLKSVCRAAGMVAAMALVTLGAVSSPAQTFSVLYDAPGSNGIGYPVAEAIAQGRNGDPTAPPNRAGRSMAPCSNLLLREWPASWTIPASAISPSAA